MPPQQSTSVPQRRSLDTISIWALFATLIGSLFVFVPFMSIPFVATKTFLLAAGALITLAISILARLSRGNVILPPRVLIGALWLPALAYALSSIFSGVMFGNAFWGSALEPDTLGFILTAAILGTLTALLLRRVENYRAFLSTGAFVFVIAVALQILFIVVGQFAPNTISPALSIIGSYDDLAFLLGVGVISVLVTFRFLELSERVRRILILGIVGALALLAIANFPLVWILLALVSLGLFVESVMRRSSGASDADIDELGVSHDSVPVEVGEGNRSLILPLAVLAVSLFFLIGGGPGPGPPNSVLLD